MRHFWNWVRNDDESRTLYLDGVIAEESWFSDDITPGMFKEELFAGNGPITIHLNSPGGDCIAASQIYTMLMDYPGDVTAASQIYTMLMDYPGDVTIQIDGMAASAASVIAMAGTHVTMSPTSLMMIHNPFTMAMGDTEEMRKAIQLLDEVKESIITAYHIKTGLSRDKISQLMDSETWMNALKARELGFCDEVLYTGAEDLPDDMAAYTFERKSAAACLMNRVIASMPKPQNMVKEEPEHPPDVVPTPEEPKEPEPITPDNRVKAADLEKRLSLLK